MTSFRKKKEEKKSYSSKSPIYVIQVLAGFPLSTRPSTHTARAFLYFVLSLLLLLLTAGAAAVAANCQWLGPTYIVLVIDTKQSGAIAIEMIYGKRI